MGLLASSAARIGSREQQGLVVMKQGCSTETLSLMPAAQPKIEASGAGLTTGSESQETARIGGNEAGMQHRDIEPHAGSTTKD
eukprot:1031950-Pelagomonas_calceolata.AAC.4